MLRRLALGTCALVALSFAGCGDDGGADCSSFSACGGDLTGSWTIQDACVGGDFNPVGDVCPEATVDFSGVNFGGTVEFEADGTYSVASTQSGSLVFTVPGSCLDGLATSCDDLDDDDTDCSGDVADECDCTTSADDTVSETGTYATSGNNVTLTPDEDEPTTNEYCVEGDSLKFRQGDADVELTFVLTRN